MISQHRKHVFAHRKLEGKKNSHLIIFLLFPNKQSILCIVDPYVHVRSTWTRNVVSMLHRHEDDKTQICRICKILQT